MQIARPALATRVGWACEHPLYTCPDDRSVNWCNWCGAHWNIIYRGVLPQSVVFFFSRLQRLRMYDMPAVMDKKLVALLLEEAMPAGCVVEGVDFSAPEDESVANSSSLPTFIQRYENMAYSEHQERRAEIDNVTQFIEPDSSPSSKSTKQDVDGKLFEEKKVSSWNWQTVVTLHPKHFAMIKNGMRFIVLHCKCPLFDGMGRWDSIVSLVLKPFIKQCHQLIRSWPIIWIVATMLDRTLNNYCCSGSILQVLVC